MLEMLQFNINVDSSVYAKWVVAKWGVGCGVRTARLIQRPLPRYYFELRSLAEQSHRSFTLEPLSRQRASKLEAMSAQVGEKERSRRSLATRYPFLASV